MIIADGVWWRRAVDPKFDAEAVLPMFFDITRYMLLDRGRSKGPIERAGGNVMKGSRIVAVGLVVGAIGWVASGHLVPHEIRESRAAIRTEPSEPKPFRVAVIDTSVAPHSRKLILSGRTEADKKVTITARTGGVLTEMRDQARPACEEGRYPRRTVRRRARSAGRAGDRTCSISASPSSKRAAS